MGYEIVRDRRFINLGDGRILPITLSGSNNCTMYRGGREVMERNWGLMFFGLNNIKTGDELIAWAEEAVEKWHGNYNQEWFKVGGKWIVGKDIIQWMKNGIKNAHTVEEYLELAHTTVNCQINIYHGDCRWDNKPMKFCRTTEELLAFIEEYNNTEVEGKDEKYATIRFCGIEPLKMPKAVKEETYNSFICKLGRNRYISDYTKTSVSTTVKKEEAEVFTSKDVLETLSPLCLHFGYTVQPISTASKSLTEEKNYFVEVTAGSYKGYYVKKKGHNSLHFTSYANSAIKFPSEKSAQRYIDTLMGHFDGATDFVVRHTEG